MARTKQDIQVADKVSKPRGCKSKARRVSNYEPFWFEVFKFVDEHPNGGTLEEIKLLLARIIPRIQINRK